MHVLMTASSVVARTTRIWMHARYAMHRGTRSGEMTLVILRANVRGRESLQADVVCSYNTTLETFVHK
jgi:hypothetical protein